MTEQKREGTDFTRAAKSSIINQALASEVTMAKPPRDQTSFGSHTYFVTATTSGKRYLLQTERMARLFIKTIFDYRNQKKLLLHEFVVMPNHFHILLTPIRIPLERAVQFIKGVFSYRVKTELGLTTEIWERGYVDHRIRDANDYARHVKYIHQNPVETRIVADAVHYEYSSAYPGFGLDACPMELQNERRADCVRSPSEAKKPVSSIVGTARLKVVPSRLRIYFLNYAFAPAIFCTFVRMNA